MAPWDFGERLEHKSEMDCSCLRIIPFKADIWDEDLSRKV